MCYNLCLKRGAMADMKKFEELEQKTCARFGKTEAPCFFPVFFLWGQQL